MFQWVPYAFIRITLFFLAGILLGIYQPGLLNANLVTLLLCTGAALFAVLSRWRTINPGAVGLFSLTAAGYLNVWYHTHSNNPSHFMHAELSIGYYRVVITEPAEEKANSWKQLARVEAIKPIDNDWQSTTGKVLLYFSKSDFKVPYRYGDVLVIKGSPHALEPPANPGEFDYKRFLSFRNIYHQHFLRQESIRYFGAANGNFFYNLSYSIRANAQLVLSTYISGHQQQAIASALILGVTDGLDNELTQAYAASGAMHVLAVSGLHVGIIYGIILLILRPLTRNQKGKWFVAGVSILLLWGYAMITGFSPSVLRAVTMFSFVALARPLNYRTNIYNILAVSAFCLLLINPYLVMSVGFQLSYLAVIGIVYLQPLVYRLWSPKNSFLDKVWQITCVSFAAQLATFSLGILYFHQFPVYFLFSNLFVIPGAFGILLAGIALLALSYFTAVAKAVGFLLTWLIKGLNYLVFTVEQLPFSIIENMYITTFQCWLLITLLVSGILLFQHRRFVYLLAATFCSALFCLTQWQHYFAEIKPAKLVVYKISGHSAFEFSHNGQSQFYADTLLANNNERIRFHIRPNRLTSGIHTTLINDSTKLLFNKRGVTAFCWHNKLIVAIQRPDFDLPANRKIDLLIISNNAVTSWDQLKGVNAGTVIVDSSNSAQTARLLVDAAKSRSLNVYSVLHSGAYVNKPET
jgi:competence protein ComEC